MADYPLAFDYMMRDEDSTRSGRITPDPSRSHPDAVARFGLNSGAHPELIPRRFFEKNADGTPALSNESAIEIAENTYKYQYWMPIGGYQIHDQSIANKFLSLAVNGWIVSAIKIVQSAANRALGSVVGFYPLAIDGKMGQKTLEAINMVNPADLLPLIKACACDHYRAIAVATPAEAKFLPMWLVRANR